MTDKTPLGKLIEHINLNGFPKNELQIKEFDDLLTTLLPEEKQAIVDAVKSEAAREYWEGQGADAKFSYEDMMDIAGWMAAADCKRPIPELKEEAETYIKIKLAARSPLPAPPNQ